MSFYLVNDEELIFVPYNLMAVDFEFVTTKIIEKKAKKHFQEIVEIGVVQKSEDLIKEYSGIIKPRHFISSKNKDQSIYGVKFSLEDIANGIDISEAFEEIKEIYNPKETIWMSWGRAEYDILRKVCRNYNIIVPFLKEDHLDLSVEFKNFYNMKQNVSLDKALNFLHMPIVDRHNALPDARSVMNIANKMFIDGYRLKEKYIKDL
ncbi:exonuclease [Clostridium bovifaecis]|uniref:Exonuclease n=1 Tax=Clostridium bovifaecis TaxID=2184719 RepID=A0A6I6F4X3_9CLOT|nr:exonuclease [Clostridium bovifaecis]